MNPHRLASLLVPPRCVGCARPTAPPEDLCRRCAAVLAGAMPGAATIATAAGPLTVSWACGYSGVARELIHGLKFSRRLRAADAMAAAMAPLVAPGAALVPVPAAPWRRRARGFDPAEAIAIALARETGCDLVPCLARRGGRRQLGRGRAERLADPPRVRLVEPAPADAVLVDDVFTTGATLAACAYALDDVAAAVVFGRPACGRA